MSLEKRVNKFNQQSLIQTTAIILREEELKTFGERKYVMTWALIKVIELGVLFAKQKGGNECKERDIRKLFNHVCEHSNFVRDGDEEDSHFKAQVIMNTLHTQQFWFYRNILGGQLARQYHTLKNTGSKSEIYQSLVRNFGVHPFEIFKGIMLIWSSCQNQKSIYFNINSLKIFNQVSNAQNILNSISITPEQFKERILNRPFKNERFDFYDFTIAKHSPILKVGENYLIYSINAFSDFIRNFIFRVLGPMGLDNQKALRQHQEHLEAYVQNLLNEAAIDCENEKSLMKSFPDSSKYVDFLLSEEAKPLTLLEMKSAVFNPKIKVYPSKEMYFQRIKSTIIDAFEQGYALVEELKKHRKVVNSNFLIVTQEDFFVTHVTDIWEHFLLEYYEEKGISNLFDFDALPIENVLIISADELEYLISIVKESSITVDEIIKRVISYKGIDRKAFLRMYLDEFAYTSSPLKTTSEVVESIKNELNEVLQSNIKR